jgi:hypothetical protein
MKHSIHKHQLFDAVVWTTSLMFIVLLGVHEAHAGEHRYDQGPVVYRDECGSCHVAYPATLLRPAQWTVILDRLDRHFGVNASLDATAVQQVAAYLGAAKVAPAVNATPLELPRISTRPWFLKEHREWSGDTSDGRASRMSDCSACHAQAAFGDYSESSLRLRR